MLNARVTDVRHIIKYGATDTKPAEMCGSAERLLPRFFVTRNPSSSLPATTTETNQSPELPSCLVETTSGGEMEITIAVSWGESASTLWTNADFGQPFADFGQHLLALDRFTDFGEHIEYLAKHAEEWTKRLTSCPKKWMKIADMNEKCRLVSCPKKRTKRLTSCSKEGMRSWALSEARACGCGDCLQYVLNSQKQQEVTYLFDRDGRSAV